MTAYEFFILVVKINVVCATLLVVSWLLRRTCDKIAAWVEKIGKE
jgi:hypothetical protein